VNPSTLTRSVSAAGAHASLRDVITGDAISQYWPRRGISSTPTDLISLRDANVTGLTTVLSQIENRAQSLSYSLLQLNNSTCNLKSDAVLCSQLNANNVNNTYVLIQNQMSQRYGAAIRIIWQLRKAIILRHMKMITRLWKLYTITGAVSFLSRFRLVSARTSLRRSSTSRRYGRLYCLYCLWNVSASFLVVRLSDKSRSASTHLAWV